MPLQMSLEKAQARWEADKDNHDKANDYLGRIAAAYILGLTTEDETLTHARNLLAWAKTKVDPTVVENLEKLLTMAPEIPPEIAHHIAKMLAEKGHEIESASVVEVDNGGVATIRVKGGKSESSTTVH
jgi:hypothetical protein